MHKAARGGVAGRSEIELSAGWHEYSQALDLIERSDWPRALALLAEAETIFRTLDDQHGLWRALIGQALLHWRDDMVPLAIARAMAALRAAEVADDGFAAGCVAWQIANLNLGNGEYRRAADFLDQAQLALDAVGMAPPGGALAASARLCGEIARWQQMAERQQIARRDADAAIAEIRQELLDRLRLAAATVRSAPVYTSDGVEWGGYLMSSQAELLSMPELNPPQSGLGTWLSRLWRRLVRGSDAVAVEPLTRADALEPAASPPQQISAVVLAANSAPRGQGDALANNGAGEPGTVPAISDSRLAAAVAREHNEPAFDEWTIEVANAAEAPAEAEPPPTASIKVHLLGSFQVRLGGRVVESWPSGRGRAVFKYLLAHRARPLPRDTLMSAFWPDASPESARNSLNVALHGLRQALRAVADVPVVVFQNGAYRLSPDLQVWIDVEEFRRCVQAGRRHEDAGDLRAAATSYEQAAGLYTGDFMVDDLYDEWAALDRERLRVAYLDTLDRLSHIRFDQEQYAECVALCQLILAQDNCREDAHCRLMRCFSRQGQPHLALRQYQACASALREELGVEPAPATTQLHERVRQHEQV
jgi:DNA-binding SARP family transcriptional activator